MSEKRRIQIERNRIKKDYDSIFVSIGRRDGFHCQQCGATYHLVIDHVLALAQGGNSDLINLQLLCALCNSRKHDRYYDWRFDAEIPHWDFDANDKLFPLYDQYKYAMQAPWLDCKVNHAQCVGLKPPVREWAFVSADEIDQKSETIYRLPESLTLAPANKRISCYVINSAYGFWGSQGGEWYKVDPVVLGGA